MAKFYLDHDVSALLAGQLRLLDHDVLTTPQMHNERASDVRQLLTAAEQDRILITHNVKHFELLHTAWLLFAERWSVSDPHPGILLIPQAAPGLPEWLPPRAAQQVAAFIARDIPLANHLYIWQRQSGWRPVTP